MLKKSSLISSVLVLLGCCSLSIALCAPAFDRLFASDDYCILDHFAKGGGIMIEGFFRPIAGLTMLTSFGIAGWSSNYFYLILAVLHGINGWLVYELCRRVVAATNIRMAKAFPIIAALFFLTYHSVGEVIFWALCQGISVAVSLSLIASVIFFSGMRRIARYILVPLLYLTALSTYESVLLFPAILLAAILIFRLKESLVIWTSLFGIVFLANILFRIWYTGRLWASYSGVVFSKSAKEYFTSFSKSLSRIFVPYFDAPMLFVSFTVVIAGAIIWALTRAAKLNAENKRMITWVGAGLVFAALPAMFYGASTRTGEGDRFLYFPAVFVSILLAYLVYNIRRIQIRWIAFVMIVVLGFASIWRTRSNWMEADRQVRGLLSHLKVHTARPIYISGLPDEYHGAFQFRNCFNVMLERNGVPGAGQVIKLSNNQAPPGGTLTARWEAGRLVIDK